MHEVILSQAFGKAISKNCSSIGTSSLLPLCCKVGGEVLKERGRSIHGHASDAVIHKLLWKNVGCLYLPTVRYGCLCRWYAHYAGVHSMALFFIFSMCTTHLDTCSVFVKLHFFSVTLITHLQAIFYSNIKSCVRLAPGTYFSVCEEAAQWVYILQGNSKIVDDNDSIVLCSCCVQLSLVSKRDMKSNIDWWKYLWGYIYLL